MQELLSSRLMAAEDFAYYAQMAPVCLSTIYTESAGSIYAQLSMFHDPCFRLKLPCMQLWPGTICTAVSIPRSVGTLISSYFS